VIWSVFEKASQSNSRFDALDMPYSYWRVYVYEKLK